MNIVVNFKANNERAIIQATSANELLKVLNNNELLINTEGFPDIVLTNMVNRWFRLLSSSIPLVSQYLDCSLYPAPSNIKILPEVEKCPTCGKES